MLILGSGVPLFSHVFIIFPVFLSCLRMFVFPQSPVENPVPKGMLLGGEASGRWPGRESRPFRNRFRVYIKTWPKDSPPSEGTPKGAINEPLPETKFALISAPSCDIINAFHLHSDCGILCSSWNMTETWTLLAPVQRGRESSHKDSITTPWHL